MARASCPSCRVSIKANDSFAGKMVQCPQCRTMFQFPAVTVAYQPGPAPTPKAEASFTVVPKPIPWFKIRVGVLLFILACAGVYFLTQLAGRFGGFGFGGTDTMDFIDHTEKYDGKTVTLRVRVMVGGGLKDIHVLQQNLPFELAGSRGKAVVNIDIPPDVTGVPNATMGDTVTITFRCSGSLQFGNIAKSVSR